MYKLITFNFTTSMAKQVKRNTVRRRNNPRLSRTAVAPRPSVKKPRSLVPRRTNPLLKRARRVRRTAVRRNIPMSVPGRNFLKCAFAPPDFASTQFSGIPDNFRGRTLLKRHMYTTSLNVTSGTDYYILLLPVPGYTMFMGTLPAGTPVNYGTAFQGQPYPDFTSLFTSSTATTSSVVNAYRFVSNHFELVSTTNEMTWSGMITVFKLPVKMVVREGGSATSDLFALTGLQGCNALQSDLYSGSSKEGVYVGNYSEDSSFVFQPVYNNITSIPSVLDADSFGYINSGVGSLPLPGLDNSFECSLVRITGLTTANSFIMRHWACVEYKVVANSTLYEYQSISPPFDPVAMQVYRETIIQLPIAVPANQNANFWQRVLQIINQITGYTSAVPGPVGAISTGVNMIGRTMQQLAF